MCPSPKDAGFIIYSYCAVPKVVSSVSIFNLTVLLFKLLALLKSHCATPLVGSPLVSLCDSFSWLSFSINVRLLQLALLYLTVRLLNMLVHILVSLCGYQRCWFGPNFIITPMTPLVGTFQSHCATPKYDNSYYSLTVRFLPVGSLLPHHQQPWHSRNTVKSTKYLFHHQSINFICVLLPFWQYPTINHIISR